MQVRLLGKVDVLLDGVPRPVRGLRRQAVLAALALHPGEVVGRDRLVDIVWGDVPPPAAAVTLQSHLSHLRGVLGDRSAIVADARGYRLAAGTDVAEAERLMRAGDFRAALALWRGRPLDGLTGFAAQAERLNLLHRQAEHGLIDARLALGEHDRLLPELERQAREYPYDERTCRQLMLALRRAGRPDEALAAYRRLERALVDDLGIGPSRAAGVPEQLPPATALTGRSGELARLDDLLAATGEAVVVCAVSGGPGVGKTALAVHWAHRVAAQFPDGQLVVDLRATDPAEAIRGVLEAFGVKGGPSAALYRSTLANRRVLIVLDDARDAEQVRPLLPGTPGCLVVVTSRDQLTGLIAAEGAHPLALDRWDGMERPPIMGHT